MTGGQCGFGRPESANGGQRFGNSAIRPGGQCRFAKIWIWNYREISGAENGELELWVNSDLGEMVLS